MIYIFKIHLPYLFINIFFTQMKHETFVQIFKMRTLYTESFKLFPPFFLKKEKSIILFFIYLFLYCRSCQIFKPPQTKPTSESILWQVLL